MAAIPWCDTISQDNEDKNEYGSNNTWCNEVMRKRNVCGSNTLCNKVKHGKNVCAGSKTRCTGNKVIRL